MRTKLPSLLLCVQLAACATAGSAEAAQRKPLPRQSEPATIAVDLREAGRHLLHVNMVLPAQEGTMALVYPKWIPGEHSPTGPVTDLVSLQIRAGEALLPWRRDNLDVYRFLVDVPRGVSSLSLSFDFISPPAGQPGFSSGASMTPGLAVLSWNQVLLVPEGAAPESFSLRASVQLPAKWKDATALEEESRTADRVSFKPVSMEKLIDSPLLAAEHLQVTQLGENHGAKVLIAVAAETEAELQINPAQLKGMQNLVAEEAALFGARHFEQYQFLLTVSDGVAHFGLEHHQSSDDRLAGRALIDPELSLAGMGLLGHESVHSWNGKYRRPAGLATPDYQAPMKGDLLWVYEGLTEYLGEILTARAGFYDVATARDVFADAAQEMRESRGRTTRPLSDTAVGAQLFYAARSDWSALRRGVDFYLEGQLLWLEADVKIREKTHGAKSLDDFCKLFFGGESTGPRVVPYDLKELVTDLNKVSPDDWDGFFAKRIYQTSDDAPLEGLVRAGWKLSTGPEASPMFKAEEKRRKVIDLRASVGFVLEADAGSITDLIPGSAADKAGLAPGMKLIAVNSRRFTPEMLRTALDAKLPLVLLVENADSFSSTTVDYRGGPAYPHLERIEGTPDLFSQIVAPHAPPAQPHPQK